MKQVAQSFEYSKCRHSLPIERYSEAASPAKMPACGRTRVNACLDHPATTFQFRHGLIWRELSIYTFGFIWCYSTSAGSCVESAILADVDAAARRKVERYENASIVIGRASVSRISRRATPSGQEILGARAIGLKFCLRKHDSSSLSYLHPYISIFLNPQQVLSFPFSRNLQFCPHLSYYTSA